MNTELINRARSELAGNVTTGTRPLIPFERLCVYWYKINILILESENERKNNKGY